MQASERKIALEVQELGDRIAPSPGVVGALRVEGWSWW